MLVGLLFEFLEDKGGDLFGHEQLRYSVELALDHCGVVRTLHDLEWPVLHVTDNLLISDLHA